MNQPLILSQHAKTQIEQRGHTIQSVQSDWKRGMFVLCFMEKKHEHFVAFIPEQEVFFLLVTAFKGGAHHVITYMPLTHRDRAVPDQFKNEAYNLRNETEFAFSSSLEGGRNAIDAILRDIYKNPARL